jgi:hypothetical protein
MLDLCAEGRALEAQAYLGAGSAGVVVAYALPNGRAPLKQRNWEEQEDEGVRQAGAKSEPPCVAVKSVPRDEAEDDLRGWALLLEMRNRGCACAQALVPMYAQATGPFECFFMPVADGTLYEVLRERPPGELRAAMRALLAALRALVSDGYAYSDLKPENVLLKREAGGRLRLVLGDLGSLVRLGEEGPVTYPPPGAPTGLGLAITEGVMLWGAGALLLAQLLNDHRSQLTYVRNAEGWAPARVEAHARSVRDAAEAMAQAAHGRCSSCARLAEYCMRGEGSTLAGAERLLEREEEGLQNKRGDDSRGLDAQ